MNPIVTSAQRFIFRSYTFDRATGDVVFTYAIDDDEFVERLTLPLPASGIPEGIDDTLNRALFALHLIAGVSYYKAKLPPKIIVESGALSTEQTVFWNKLYTLGLGEFFFQNQLDFRDYINFPISDVAPIVHTDQSNVSIAASALLPIGGGKDSLVAVEMLKAANVPFDLVMFGNHARIREVAGEVGKPLLPIARSIDPKLIDLNKAGAWNGHVPITAYVSIASYIVALLHGKRDVIFANERSANSGNAEFEGVMINHQYSKSLEAERDLQVYLAAFVSPSVRVFSLLRPMSELDIARRFASNGKYFGVFSSCNRNYKQGGVPSVTRWCGKCPKCAFVFVMLGAFIPRRRMVEMFGEDLLVKPELLVMYKDLTGYGTMKPFECVGEFEEVIAAFALIHGRGEYEDSVIMQWFIRDVMNTRRDIDALIDRALTLSPDHAMPQDYATLVYASR
jgi:UDP-N-acetyl-alpha-D-muramoyl-L-alanyl-L-glutamate epimerase